MAENWISHVEDLMPSNIAHLFFFDGEQIESYASFSNSSVLIGAAIQNLLGLDLVDQLEKDFLIYERRKRTQDKDNAARSEIDAAENDLRELRTRSETLAQERAALRTHKIDQKRKALNKLEEEFRKLGGNLYEQRAQIERQLAKADEEAAGRANALRELASGALPLLIVRDLLDSASARDGSEESGRRARDIFEVLEERDKAVLQYLSKQATDKSVVSSVKTFLDGDRAARKGDLCAGVFFYSMAEG